MSGFDLDYYVAAAADVIAKSSRTVASGRVDTSYSASPDKPKGIIDDPAKMRERAEQNVREAVMILDAYRSHRFNKIDFADLFEKVAKKVRADTIAADAPLYRAHEIKSKKSDYGCPVSQIHDGLDRFFGWAAEMMNTPLSREDVPRYSGLLEKIIDKDLHPLADACGRVGKLFSVLLAMRNDAPVKVFPGREAYYAAMEPKRTPETMFDLASAAAIMELYAAQADFVK